MARTRVFARVPAVRAASTRGDPAARTLPLPVKLALNFTPLALMSLVYNLAAPELAATRVGGGSLHDLYVALAFVAPWLYQAVCAPLYSSIGIETFSVGREETSRALLARLPWVGGVGIVAAILVAWGVGRSLHWDRAMIELLAGLLAAHLVFAQLLVDPAIRGEWSEWVAAWCVYAMMLAAFPSQWWLPAGVASTQLLLGIAGRSRTIPRPRFELAMVESFCRGGLLGSLLWADKVWVLVSSPTPPVVVFAGLLPAMIVLAVNSAHTGPMMERGLNELMESMSRDDIRTYETRKRLFRRRALGALLEWVLIGGVSAVAVLEALRIVTPTMVGSEAYLVWVMIGSLSMTTAGIVATYLEMMGARHWGMTVGAAYLAVVIVGIGVGRPDPMSVAAFAALIGCVLTLGLSWVLGREARCPEYRLFWRKSIVWR